MHAVTHSQYPALPDVLKARPTDKLFDLPKPNSERFAKASDPISTAGYYTSFHLNELKQFTLRQRKEVPIKEYRRNKYGPNDSIAALFLDDEILVTMVPWPEAQARVDELIAAIEVWRKACRKIDHDSGLLKAEREYTRLGNRHHLLLKKISKIEAKSLQGILVKARAVKLIHGDDDAIEFGEATDELLAASILNELLSLKA